ncbi:hypothetical protein GON03_18945 [Nocardioides sp. MAH-18]|uniref:Uncharacterized protein n=1 Tax=Nocardioides agri TaxID=2682843 RepID=A0A6L6XX43_9ACTN|nr:MULTISPECIES: hypothetical protein [unclassified Nocardioides]MBA2952094.1 hypothetical protein [Nocardioides sp. CGMCC 1.13656]MVQ51263.1 hypothetical protein [Nocardioides sp. MAH-18]
MANFVAGGLTSAGSTTLPVAALVGSAAVLPRIREIGVFNTTSTAVALKLCRLTTAGTPGASLGAVAMNPRNPEAAVAALRNTYSSTAPTTTDLGFRAVLGAAVGSGFVWTFDDFDLCVDAAANAGVGILVENGTGQALQVYFKWSE